MNRQKKNVFFSAHLKIPMLSCSSIPVRIFLFGTGKSVKNAFRYISQNEESLERKNKP